MQLLPYATFTIQTQELLSAVIEKLDAQIEAPRAFRWDFSRNHAPYEGTLSSSGFEIRRITHILHQHQKPVFLQLLQPESLDSSLINPVFQVLLRKVQDVRLFTTATRFYKIFEDDLSPQLREHSFASP